MIVEEIRRKYGSEMADAIQKHINWLEKFGLKWKMHFNFSEENVVIGIIDETFFEIFIYSKKEKRMTGQVRLVRSELNDVLYQMDLLRGRIRKWIA